MGIRGDLVGGGTRDPQRDGATRAVACTVVGAAAKAALMAPTLVIRLTEAPVRPVAEMSPTSALAVTLPASPARRIDPAAAVAWTATVRGTRRT